MRRWNARASRIEMKLRRATRDDADLLLAWRNDPTTRAMSLNMAAVTHETHMAWFAAKRELIFIAEVGSTPVGAIRADAGELSWTVAPEARGKGIGTQMLRMFVQSAPGALTAVIKKENIASIRMVESLGFTRTRESGNVVEYRYKSASVAELKDDPRL